MIDLFLNPAFISGLLVGTTFGVSTGYIIFKKNSECDNGNETEENVELKNEEYRLIMAVRNDLKMTKGKVAAQCAHAAVAAFSKATTIAPKLLKLWLKSGQPKITVRIDSEEELQALDRAARKRKLLTNVVRDAGHTQVTPGSKTVIAIGPGPKSILDEVTGHLKLF